ncbi:uncharacterized protein LOC135346330 isoform X2 [Halichondria panicea]|uniref:uncharacterized protein LOC135346330 isoform X2 n=1 Tax=Halichondria panicea TaxID=6063 RepID=UPI00312B56D9
MAYNLANSLSPMMFQKTKGSKSDQGGTRNERWRSKSVENIAEIDGDSRVQVDKRFWHKSGSKQKHVKDVKDTCERVQWRDLSRVKSIHPVVTCVLPSLAMDFVASALLAVGATPLITEDPEDILRDLDVCKAVVLDMSAPQVIVEAFIANFELGSKPLVLVASECGTNDRKKDLAMRVIDESGPNFITGKLVDIFTLSGARNEKSNSQFGSSDSEENGEGATTSQTTPKVVLSTEKNETELSSLPPALRRRMKMRRSTSPSGSPADSPKTSPPDSTFSSPKNSPRSSPILKRRGIQKLIRKKQRANSEGALKRVPTVIPRLRMKGQFRDTKSHDIKLEDALDAAQNLAAHTTALIHIYEANVVTSGEVIVEVTNNQVGMGNLHSTLPVCAAVVSAVLACVEDDIELKHCVHALALYYVAAEEGAACASTSEKGVISPGTLRTNFIDALHYMQESEVNAKAEVFAHTEGIKTAFN